MATPSFELLRKRSEFIRRIRGFFEDRQFTEIQSPLLVAEPGFESNLQPFETTVTDFYGDDQRRFLITSPELWMKRVLAQAAREGVTDACTYQLSACFRNGEVDSPLHTPEFTLLEWYRMGTDYMGIIDDMQKLFTALGLPELTVLTMQEAFCEFTDLDVVPADEEEFLRIFITDIEPKLTAHIIKDYPEYQAALSVVTDGVAQRFEVFLNGVELANGFSELVDADIQRERCTKDLSDRKEYGYADLPVPTNFLNELGDMPASGGVALGIDRLFMVWAQQNLIIRWD